MKGLRYITMFAAALLLAVYPAQAQTITFDFSDEPQETEMVSLSSPFEVVHSPLTMILNGPATGAAGASEPGATFMDLSTDGTYLYLYEGTTINFMATEPNVFINAITIYFHAGADINAIDPITELLLDSEGEDYKTYVAPSADATLASVDFNVLMNTEVLRFEVQYSSEGGTTAEVPIASYDDINHILTLTTATDGATIYYTIDGSLPDPNMGTTLVYSGPFELTENVYVQFCALAPGQIYYEGDTPIGEFILNDFQCLVEFSFEYPYLTIKPTPADSHVYYTIDGTSPADTLAAQFYTDPIDLTSFGLQTFTVQAIAIRSGFNDSEVASYIYNASDNTASPPVITREGDQIVITTETPGARIYYGIDVSTPTEYDTEYTGPFTPTRNGLLEVVVIADGMEPAYGRYVIDWFNTEPVQFSYEYPYLTMTSATDGAIILYTLDGTTPSSNAVTIWDQNFIQFANDLYMEMNEMQNTFDVTVSDGDTQIIDGTSMGTLSVAGYDVPFNADLLAEHGGTWQLAFNEATGGASGLQNNSDGTRYIGLRNLPAEMTISFFANAEEGITATNASLIGHVGESYSFKVDADGEVKIAIPAQTSIYNLQVSKMESLVYTGPVELIADTRVRAIAMADGYNASPETNFEFSLADYSVAAPQFTRNGNEVTITSATDGAAIYYTLDGTVPDGVTAGTLYEAPVQVTENGIIIAIAMREGMAPSEPVFFDVDWFQTEPVTFSFSNLHLTMSSATPNATIYYTLDGSEPTDTLAAMIYTEPIELEVDCEVRALAVREGFFESEVTTFQFVRSAYTAAAPQFTRNENELTLTSTTENAIIYYTLDGTEPDPGLGGTTATYTGPIQLDGNYLVQAIAARADLFPSAIAQYTVEGFQVASVQFTFANRRLIMETSTDAATIYYTTDNSIPDTTSTVYTEPVELTQDCTVQAIAARDNWMDAVSSSYEFIVAEHTAATPQFTVNENELTITSATPNALIYYTTDGSDPEEGGNSLLYDAPIQLEGNIVVKAIAASNDFFPSPVATYNANSFQVADVTFSFENLRLLLATSTDGATIYYTTDGTVPDSINPGTQYIEPLELNQDCIVQAIALRDSWAASNVTSYEFVLAQHTVETPQFSRVGNQLIISSATPDAHIYYTTDDTDPTQQSTLYTAAIELDGNVVINAIALADNMYPSAINHYVVSDFKVEPVEFSYANLMLTMSSATAGATIYYTLDGTEPTETSEIYTQPIELHNDATIRAIAMRGGWNSSEVTDFAFVLAEHTVAMPQFSRNGNELYITTATPGATILYSLDGTEPQNEYSSALVLDRNCIVRAMAVLQGQMYPSEIADYQVNWFKVAEVEFSYNELALSMSTSTPDATIYYTTDGTEPTTASTRYVAPFSLDADCVVQAIAVREGWNDSDIASFVFSLANVTAESPQFTRSGNLLSIVAPTEGTMVYYTTDGSIPSMDSQIYQEPIQLTENCVVRAIAAGQNFNSSPVVSYNVDWFKAQTVEFAYEDLMLFMSTQTVNAQIYYTTDGSFPTTESNLYTDPVSLTQDCDVRAIAIRPNWTNSDLALYHFTKASVTAATPQFARNGNQLTLSSAGDVTIFYTLDGTVPDGDQNGTAYTAPIQLTENVVVRAIAMGEGYFPSAVNSYTVDWFKVANVEFAYEHQTLTMSTPTNGAIIYYTLDGSVPNGTTVGILYQQPIQLTGDCDVNAIAVRENWNNSGVSLFHFNLNAVTAAAPQFTRSGNTLTMASATSGVTIYYTTDGSAPTAQSELYSGPVQLTRNCIIRAIAVGDNYLQSATSAYTVDWFKTAAVEFALEELRLFMTTPSEDAVIYYTTDGTVPTTSSQVFDMPIELTADCDVRAIAVHEGWNNSDVTLYHFLRAAHTAATPLFSRSGNQLALTTTTTSGVTIYYTTDGTEPTEASTPYTAPFTVTQNGTVRAIAIGHRYFPSAIASYNVDWFKVANVDFRIEDHFLVLTTTTEGAEIFYTLDGSMPTTDSEHYEFPIELMEENFDVRAIAIREGWNNSEVSVFHYSINAQPAATPVFSRNGDVLTITTTTEDAIIYYTLDGSEPSTSSILYTDPIELTQNGMVKAIAVSADNLTSGIASFAVNWFTVPNIVFSFAGQQLTMQPENGDTEVTIYYTLDGSAPTTASAVYTAPIRIQQSCIVQAFGTKRNYLDSNISRYELDLDHLAAATPEFNRNGNLLEIFCATADATIYYTIDGSMPTEQSILYTGPISLTQNCTIRAIAVANGYRNSGISDYTTDTFRVEEVAIEFVDGFVYLSTATPNAVIYYTTDDTTPTTQSEVYNVPIFTDTLMVVRAFGAKEGFTPSRITLQQIDPEEVRCATPTFILADRILTISTLTEGATIYYTLDGTRPTTASTVYAGPVTLEHNCVVQAVAMKEQFRISDVAARTIDNFYAELPSFAYDSSNGKVTINSLTDGAAIHYTLDGTEPTAASATFAEPIVLAEGQTVSAYAVADGFNDSEVTTFNPLLPTCAPVLINYDGHNFQLTSTTAGADIYYTLDGSNPTVHSIHYDGTLTAADDLCTIRAIAAQDGANSSNVSIYELPSYCDGETATVRTAGTLSTALQWTDGMTLETLTVLGNINDTDFATLCTKGGLRHLDLKQVAVEGAALPDRAFAGASIVSVNLPSNLTSAGSHLFDGCANLASIAWNINGDIPEGALDGITNPNLLLYVGSASDARHTGIQNIVVGRRAERITLSDADETGNFYCMRPFFAQDITYTHEYTMQSGIKERRGWETLSLPFNVSRIAHATKGDISPFGNDDNKPHFWLYTLESDVFAAATDIVAHEPYIISMPNHESYADRYNLAGSITFEGIATTVGITEPHARRSGNDLLVANFERRSATAPVQDFFTINREAEGDNLEGSIFVRNLRDARPFEAYKLTSDPNASYIKLFGGTITAIEEVPAEMLKSNDVNADGIYDLSGRRVVAPTQQGIYIRDGKKIVVK